jgi:formyl-CoA transferase
VIGRPELASDERFATNADRVRNRDQLIPIVSEELARRPAAEWVTALEAASVPCAPVRTLDEVFASPEGAATIQAIDDPERGSLRLVADPIRVDGRVPPARTPPPRLGEHTDDVRSELER